MSESTTARSLKAVRALQRAERAQAQHPDLPVAERTRLVNASARMMQAYQDGLLTLKKARRGGRQAVVVQHEGTVDEGPDELGEIAGRAPGRHLRRPPGAMRVDSHLPRTAPD